MITESISTNIFVSTIMFFFVIVLLRNVLLDNKLKKHEVIIMPLLFLMWFGGTKILVDFYFSEDIVGLITNTSVSFLFLTTIYLFIVGFYLFFQELKIINIIYITIPYIVLSLISIYL